MEIMTHEGAPRYRRPPEILRYHDYRLFLKDSYLHRKSLRNGFSFRQFASLVGLKSPNYLQLVIQSKRNLTVETAERIAKALKLNANETLYFLALIKESVAKSEEELTEARRQKMIAIKRLTVSTVPKAQQEVLTKWYHLLVRELVLFSDFQPTGDYISRRLGGLITPEEAELSLRYLIEAGFVAVSENQTFALAEPVLSTGVSTFSRLQLQKLHAQMLSVWAKNIERLNFDRQEVHYLNIPIREEKIDELKRRIQTFQEEIIGWLQDETDPDRLVQLGSYLMAYPSIKDL